ncbi:MAG: hypothetical protein EXR54_06830 [Dehalococcoidia bacterium]|nr:hypothetical protein [Dehalococcoidia bacterium]MSQ17265.1 hypothetical protein [Dehalococcoidia bacterium]
MLVESNIYTYLVPAARAIAAFFLAGFFGILGGWIGTTFSAFLGYPWSLQVHNNIYIVSIGLGGGAGGYLAWVDLTPRWYWMAAAVLAVMLGGVAATYAGYAYGQVADESFLGRGYTVENALHWGAALGGFGVATLLGICNEFRTRGR